MEKNKGNEAFRSKDYKEAKGYYTKSLIYFKDAKVYSNRAAVELKLKEYDQCIKDCNEAIKLDKEFLKPYNRRASAYTSLKQYEKAINDY